MIKNLLGKVYFIPFIFLVQSSFAFEGVLNLRCDLGYLDPDNFTATIVGPSQGIYEFELNEQFYGAVFNNKYALKLDHRKNLTSKKATVRDLGRDPKGRLVIEVTSREVTALRLVCK